MTNVNEWIEEQRKAVEAAHSRVWLANSVDLDKDKFPRALDALAQVLEQIEFMETDAEELMKKGEDSAYKALLDYAQTLREAIEKAIGE